MKAKKKLKKKTKARVATVKRPILISAITKDLIKRLKKNGMAKTEIAKHLGYRSHNTITNWFSLGGLPKHNIVQVKKLLRG